MQHERLDASLKNGSSAKRKKLLRSVAAQAHASTSGSNDGADMHEAAILPESIGETARPVRQPERAAPENPCRPVEHAVETTSALFTQFLHLLVVPCGFCTHHLDASVPRGAGTFAASNATSS